MSMPWLQETRRVMQGVEAVYSGRTRSAIHHRQGLWIVGVTGAARLSWEMQGDNDNAPQA